MQLSWIGSGDRSRIYMGKQRSASKWLGKLIQVKWYLKLKYFPSWQKEEVKVRNQFPR
jgi:hypothetical protein